jgi:hypothetical protein
MLMGTSLGLATRPNNFSGCPSLSQENWGGFLKPTAKVEAESVDLPACIAGFLTTFTNP